VIGAATWPKPHRGTSGFLPTFCSFDFSDAAPWRKGYRVYRRRGGLGVTDRHCIPLSPGTPPLAGEALDTRAAALPDWRVDGRELKREFRFPDFATALAFVNRVGEVAEREGHHPDIALGWGRVAISTYTHSIGGLSENDFILAAKIDALPR
jgi:4a-hydroxytetrahydrobiopterin dehydratase